MAAVLFECKWKKVKEERNTNTDGDKCIPEEILFQDILVRLPIKPILRFKSVSKRWRYLIQSPSFITSHRRYHFRGDSWGKLVQSPYTDAWKFTCRDYGTDTYPTSYSPLFVNLVDPYNHPVLPPEISIDRLEMPRREEGGYMDTALWTRHIHVFGPMNNGIYCIVANLQCLMGHCPHFESVVTGKIAFCNPGTRDYKLANPFPSEMVPHLTQLARSKCRGINYGFGSVEKDGIINHDYKVVVIITCKTSFLAFVYSHRRGTWETLVDYELGKRDLFKPKAVDGIAVRTQGKVLYPKINPDFMICTQGFFNGCWHWMAWKPDDRSSIVLSFHMGDEVFKFFGGAPGYVKSQITPGGMPMISWGSVSVLNHHLAAFYRTAKGGSDSDTLFDVWMMMEYGVEESWTKIYAIQPKCPFIHKLVGITTSVRDDCIGGIQIEKVVFRDFHGKLISCDDSVVENHGFSDVSFSVYWNTLGFSAYSPTLERVSISVEEEDDGVVANSS